MGWLVCSLVMWPKMGSSEYENWQCDKLVSGVSCASADDWHPVLRTHTPTLRDTLHWLPISQRIIFIIALMMFNCSRGRCPKYFGDVYTPVHTVGACSRLQSADRGDLVVPRVWSTHFGWRSFRVCGPTIWNKFPQDLQSTDTREQNLSV